MLRGSQLKRVTAVILTAAVLVATPAASTTIVSNRSSPVPR